MLKKLMIAAIAAAAYAGLAIGSAQAAGAGLATMGNAKTAIAGETTIEKTGRRGRRFRRFRRHLAWHYYGPRHYRPYHYRPRRCGYFWRKWRRTGFRHWRRKYLNCRYRYY